MTATPIATQMAITAADSPSIDAFGRWRTSDIQTIFDSKQLSDSAPLVWDDQEESGSGTTSTHSVDNASTTIAVAGSTAGKRTRQTFMRFNYQPGKSFQIFMTFNLDKTGGGTGITRTIGYGDDNNGVFLRDNEGTYELVIRTHTSGSAVDTAVSQANWNVDKFDGTGPSGITLDFSDTQILFVDLEWLGVGRVRMGFVIDGKIYYAHYFNHANVIQTVYMSTPNLPLRYQIENDGTGVASSLQHICSSVSSEGGYDDLGVLHSAFNGVVTSLNSPNLYALMSGRLKTTHFGTSIDVIDLSGLVTTNDRARWGFYVGGTVAGTHTYVDEPTTAVQIARGDATNTYTPGKLVSGGYFTQNLPTLNSVQNALRLGSAIDGTPQEWHLVIAPLAANLQIAVSVGWREMA